MYFMKRRTTPRFVSLAAYLFSAAIGLFVALWAFPPGFLFPSPTAAFPIPIDMTQHIIGQRYFIADDWRWPLLVTKNLNVPEGSHIAFSNSIPLEALALKVLSPLLPAGFHGVGLWCGISWLLQPLAATWCVRAAGEKRLLPSACAALIAAATPFWWNRFGHSALSGQFTILFVLGAYFLLMRGQNLYVWLIIAVGQASILLIHPYLWAMTIPLLAAVPISLFLDRRSEWRVAAAGTLCCLAISGVFLAGLGYLGAKGDVGFGSYAMNLLSPVWPAGSGLLANPPARLSVTPGSDWEGYTYLGAGVVFGLVVVLLARLRPSIQSIAHHGGLVLVCVALTALAISNNVGLGPWVLQKVYTAPDLFQQFRTTARFFWPVGYVLMISSVLGAAAFRSRWLSAGLLAAMTLLQMLDIRPMVAGVANATRSHNEPWLIDAAGLRAVFRNGHSLTLIPRWNCMPDQDVLVQQKQELQILLVASETPVPANSMYQARWYTIPICADDKLIERPFEPSEVRVLLPSVAGKLGA